MIMKENKMANTGSGGVLIQAPSEVMKTTVEIKSFKEGATIPKKATEGAAGYDLCACISEYTSGMMIHPHSLMVVPTGLNVNIPEGYEIQIRPRSGLAAKHGVTVLNTPGTIDSDYSGDGEDFELK